MLVIDPDASPSTIRVISYGPGEVHETSVTDPAEIRPLLGRRAVTWINIDGLGDAQMLRKVGEVFDLHPLSLADVVNTHQRPKIEPYDDHLFMVTRMAMIAPAESGDAGGDDGAPHMAAPSTVMEQVSIVVGENYVLSFQERAGDVFDALRDRIRSGKGRVRSMGADYLAYALVDAVVDGYFPVLDGLSERIESLEEETVTQPNRWTVAHVHGAKRDLLALRRAMWPQREAINAMLRDESRFISPEVKLYLRDVYDHAVQVIDILETYRELVGGLMDLYLSSVSNRMNEVMKVLTIIATIFIPLTFIAGIYGMNFAPESSPLNMPELTWYWGYPASLALMAVIALALLIYFHRRGWIGRSGG